MKKIVLTLAALGLAGMVYGCDNDNNNKLVPPGTDSKSDDDGKSDGATDEEGKLLEELATVCAGTSGLYADCYTAKNGRSLMLACTDGVLEQAGLCREHSSCVKVESEFSCTCDREYDLSQNDAGEYYCKEKPEYPAEVKAFCADAENGATKCVAVGNDVWAAYCVEKYPYANENTGNCSALGQKCGQVTYKNGTFNECADCLEDKDCPADTALAHSAGKCVIGKCSVGCEFGYKYLAEEEDWPAECKAVKDPCHTVDECHTDIANTKAFCTDNECHFYCQDDYSYKWEDGEWVGCEKTQS